MFLDPTLAANVSDADTLRTDYPPGFSLAQEILDFSEAMAASGLSANAGGWQDQERDEKGRFTSGGGGGGGDKKGEQSAPGGDARSQHMAGQRRSGEMKAGGGQSAPSGSARLQHLAGQHRSGEMKSGGAQATPGRDPRLQHMAGQRRSGELKASGSQEAPSGDPRLQHLAGQHRSGELKARGSQEAPGGSAGQQHLAGQRRSGEMKAGGGQATPGRDPRLQHQVTQPGKGEMKSGSKASLPAGKGPAAKSNSKAAIAKTGGVVTEVDTSGADSLAAIRRAGGSIKRSGGTVERFKGSANTRYLPAPLTVEDVLEGLTANDWEEEKHPRGEGGKFGSGGGSAATAGGGKAGAAPSGGKGGHGKGSDEGMAMEVRPVKGEGKKGAPQDVRDVDTRHLDVVDKWLSGEGKPSNHPVAKAVAYLADKGHKAEHLVKVGALALAQYTKDKVGDSVKHLPKPLQPLANAAFIGLRVAAGAGRAAAKVGLPAAFSYWTGITRIAGNVAREKGATPEQAKKIESTLSAIDMGSLEVSKGGAIASMIPALSHALHFTHSLAGVAALIPVASTAYLAVHAVGHPVATIYAAGKSVAQLGKAALGIAKHPVATAKAVGKYAKEEFKKGYAVGGIRGGATVGDKASKFSLRDSAKGIQAGGAPKKVDTVHHTRSRLYTVNTRWGSYFIYPPERFSGMVVNVGHYQTVYVWNAEVEKQATSAANMVADAMEAHDYDDWYHALLAAALDAGHKLPDAISTADAAYDAQPDGPTDEDPSMSDEEAMTALYGDWIHDLK